MVVRHSLFYKIIVLFFLSLARNTKQRRLDSQAKGLPELADSPTPSASRRAAYSAGGKTGASVSSGVTSGDSSDSAASSERMRRKKPVTLKNGSTVSGEKWHIIDSSVEHASV